MAMGIFDVLRCHSGFHQRTAITRTGSRTIAHERLIATRLVDKID